MGNDTTLDSFLKILNDPTDPNYQDAQFLVTTYFCPDNPAGNPSVPSVGLANYGPFFVGQNDVTALFAQIFTSFPDLEFQTVAARLYSPSGDQIAIQAKMTGTQKQPWFQAGPHVSPPISNIHPTGHKKMVLPACAVFSFDANAKITNLAIYFDRDRMARQLR